jgi:hypothetical protein
MAGHSAHLRKVALTLTFALVAISSAMVSSTVPELAGTSVPMSPALLPLNEAGLSPNSHLCAASNPSP